MKKLKSVRVLSSKNSVEIVADICKVQKNRIAEYQKNYECFYWQKYSVQ